MSDTSDPRINGLLMGVVVDNKDPANLNRVRVAIPGLTKESPWAFPIGKMFGVKNGIQWIPEKDMPVIVFYSQGHTDHPFYMAGPWGSPSKTGPDLPEQANSGDPNVVVIRWRDYYAKIDGTPGSEKLTVEDIPTGTKIDMIRQSGNFERVVAGPVGTEKALIKGDLQETVQTGSETHTVEVGNRTTSVTLGNDTKTVGGNDTETIGGSKTKTVTGAETDTIEGAKTETIGLTSTETVGLAKTLTAGLAITITAGAAVTITAGGVASLIGAGTVVQSAGPSANISAGLQTNTFLGGVLSTIIGAVVETIVGAKTTTAVAMQLVSASVQIGTGVFKALLNLGYHTSMVRPHVHQSSLPGVNTGTPLVPDGGGGFVPMPAVPPVGDFTANLLAS